MPTANVTYHGNKTESLDTEAEAEIITPANRARAPLFMIVIRVLLSFLLFLFLQRTPQDFSHV